MKRYLTIAAALLAFCLVGCDKVKAPTTATVTISVEKDGEPFVVEGAVISVRDLAGTATFEGLTDAEGKARFILATGNYEASFSHKKAEDGKMFNYNGINSAIAVVAGTDVEYSISVNESTVGQVIIKELYIGGCPKDDGSGAYSNDKYVILYNNSELPADASDICFSIGHPLLSNTASKYQKDENGVFSYEKEGWMPASYATWWFDTAVEIAPYSQILIAITGAIDQTATYSQSVDLSRADYCFYDPESGFKAEAVYPAPSESIPQSHYLKTFVYGTGTSWPIGNMAPAFYIHKTPDIQNLVQNVDKYDYTPGAIMPDIKIPLEYIVDAIDVFRVGYETKNTKRFPSSVDAGYIYHEDKLGYSIYRNVDKAATEAIEGNKDLLVYNYDLGVEMTDGSISSDPSGIDAEASIAQGAKIVYSDTNNSSKDFHLRQKSSLRK